MVSTRTVLTSLLPEQDVLDERLEREVGEPEEGADDHAGDQHDHRALDQLRLARPLDLLQLGDRLGDEAAAGRATAAGARRAPRASPAVASASSPSRGRS